MKNTANSAWVCNEVVEDGLMGEHEVVAKRIEHKKGDTP